VKRGGGSRFTEAAGKSACALYIRRTWQRQVEGREAEPGKPRNQVTTASRAGVAMPESVLVPTEPGNRKAAMLDLRLFRSPLEWRLGAPPRQRSSPAAAKTYAVLLTPYRAAAAARVPRGINSGVGTPRQQPLKSGHVAEKRRKPNH